MNKKPQNWIQGMKIETDLFRMKIHQSNMIKKRKMRNSMKDQRIGTDQMERKVLRTINRIHPICKQNNRAKHHK